MQIETLNRVMEWFFIKDAPQSSHAFWNTREAEAAVEKFNAASLNI